MIFVTVGTQKFPMNRLIKKVDEIAEHYKTASSGERSFENTFEENSFKGNLFFAQIGNTDYLPKNFPYERFLSQESFQDMVKRSKLIISHAGVGTMMSGILDGKKVVVVPRLKKFGEHVDDHQVEIAEAFQMKNCVIYCSQLEELEHILRNEQNYVLSPYMAPENNIQDIIMSFLMKGKI